MRKRAVKLADNWMSKIGDKLLKDTEFVGREIFKKEVQGGKRLDSN